MGPTVPKNSLSIRLTESFVFLRGAIDATVLGRNVQNEPDVEGHPAIIRGLLILTLHKPTKISSIEVALEGTARSSWPEGVGTRRLEVTEEHQVVSASTTFFKAGNTPSEARRPVSVGPGVAPDSENDEQERSASPLFQRSRRISADHTVLHQQPHLEPPPVLFGTPSPPYSPTAHPQSSSTPSLRSDNDPISAPASSEELGEPSLSPQITQFRSREGGQVDGKDPARAEGRDKAPSRFSFQAMSSALRDSFKENVRPPREPSVEAAEDRGRKRRSFFGKSAREEPVAVADASGDGWKEFRKGTYTYPISFALPSSCPPTLHCDYGSVTYRLKATVHRPGTFTPKLTASHEVVLVATPLEDAFAFDEGATTDAAVGGSIVVQRTWDTQMHYMIVIGGRAFAVGGVVPITMTLVPMVEGIKIWRLGAVLEEKIEYYTQFKRVARVETPKRFELLSLRGDKAPGDKMKEDQNVPLLPLPNPEAYWSSPLRGMVDVEGVGRSDTAETDNAPRQYGLGSSLFHDGPSPVESTQYPDVKVSPVELASAAALSGPGPWTLNLQLHLPTSCTRMHFTNKHKRSNIAITHHLKIVMRVQRGGDSLEEDHNKKEKKKLFDIVIQAPLWILSCRCSPEWTYLPRYTTFSSLYCSPSQADASASSIDLMSRSSCICELRKQGILPAAGSSRARSSRAEDEGESVNPVRTILNSPDLATGGMWSPTSTSYSGMPNFGGTIPNPDTLPNGRVLPPITTSFPSGLITPSGSQYPTGISPSAVSPLTTQSHLWAPSGSTLSPGHARAQSQPHIHLNGHTPIHTPTLVQDPFYFSPSTHPSSPLTPLHEHLPSVIPPTPTRPPARRHRDSNSSSSSVPSVLLSDRESIINRNSQFARLVAGHESEAGEAPPGYDA